MLLYKQDYFDLLRIIAWKRHRQREKHFREGQGLRSSVMNIEGVGALIPLSGTSANTGNNTVITPSAGKRLRLYYVSYNPSDAVTAAFRIGPLGGLWLKNTVVPNSVIAKDCGDTKYIQGGVDQSLYLFLSAAVSTDWNVFYVEVE